MTESTVVIKGRNELGFAVKQAERQLKGLLAQGQLVGKFFKGGAILGAAFAFERLAENAEKAADKIGDKGTAKALRQLNKEIDNLKSKGLNVIGRVLGDSYIAVAGTELQKLEVRVRNLREQLELMQRTGSGGGGRAGFELGAMPTAALEAQLAADEARLAFLRKNRPYGERDRAPGSRGGGTAVYGRPDLIQPKAPKFDPMSGLGEVNVYAREVFNFANAQSAAFEAFSADANETLRKNVQDLSNDTTRMLGEMTVEYEQSTSAWVAFAEQGARNIQDAFAEFLFDPFSEGLRGMARGFVDAIRQMLAQYLAFQAITGLGGALSGSTNPFLQSIGGFLTGKRALGGPVTAGGAYLVGEAGPELFVPRSSGQIVPNGAMAGVNVNYTIDARGADADRIMSIMPGLLRQSEQRTVAQVQQLIQRGRLA